MHALASRLLEDLACIHDGSALVASADGLRCGQGHVFPVFDGIPVLLPEDLPATHPEAARSLAIARGVARPHHEPSAPLAEGAIDPFVQTMISATCGLMYGPLIGRLVSYPLPELRAPPGEGRVFLEIGCNWGRWCVAAARRGWRPVGIDPSLEGVLAARRVTRQLGVDAAFVVADGRRLPFRAGSVDLAFSYSVLQHLSYEDAESCVQEMGRVVRDGGTVLVQLPNPFGLRSLYNIARRGGRSARGFEIRYWTPTRIVRTFRRHVGPTRVEIDGFFTLNSQPAEKHLLPRRFRVLITASELLRRLGHAFPPLTWVADSLHARATKASSPTAPAGPGTSPRSRPGHDSD